MFPYLNIIFFIMMQIILDKKKKKEMKEIKEILRSLQQNSCTFLKEKTFLWKFSLFISRWSRCTCPCTCSRIDYCNVWLRLNPLQLFLNAAAMILTKTQRQEHHRLFKRTLLIICVCLFISWNRLKRLNFLLQLCSESDHYCH